MLAAKEIREQDYYRRFVETGFMTREGMYGYIHLRSKGRGNFAPADMCTIGLFLQEKTRNELVGFQTWGASTYPDHDVTTSMLQECESEGMGDGNGRPAYTESRCVIEPGQGYGTRLRYASALLMQRAGFTVAGRKVLMPELENHVQMLQRIKAQYVFRGPMQLPTKEPLQPAALLRAEVYAPISRILSYLVDRRPWLADHRFD